MAKNNTSAKPNDHLRVLRAVEAHVRDTHQLCSIKDIGTITGLSTKKSKKLIEDLLGSQLTVVYGKSKGRGITKLYLPKYMWETILRSEKKPDWVDEEYSFLEEKEMMREIKDKYDELNKFAQFKRLLYGIGTPLEEAVAYSLRYIGFGKVKHMGGEDEHDVEFVVNNKKFIVEVGGSFSRIKKDKPKDLNEWIEKAALKRENENFGLQGMLLVNHFKGTRPNERGQVFTNHARRLIHVFGHIVVPTPSLFELIRDVQEGKTSKEEARRKVLEGQRPL